MRQKPEREEPQYTNQSSPPAFHHPETVSHLVLTYYLYLILTQHTMSEESSNGGFATRAIHVGQDPLQWSHGSLIPPICMTTTYYQVMQYMSSLDTSLY